MLAKHITTFVIFLLTVVNAFANNRPTTFDDRPACEKAKGCGENLVTAVLIIVSKN